MKKTNTIYWIITGIFAAFMFFTAIPDIMNNPKAVVFMDHLGYPHYFTPFIGVAKALGCIAIVVPGFPRLKEWAYAGLAFDLIGATYSQVAVAMQPGSQDSIAPVSFMILPFLFLSLSYIYYHKRLKAA